MDGFTVRQRVPLQIPVDKIVTKFPVVTEVRVHCCVPLWYPPPFPSLLRGQEIPMNQFRFDKSLRWRFEGRGLEYGVGVVRVTTNPIKYN